MERVPVVWSERERIEVVDVEKVGLEEACVWGRSQHFFPARTVAANRLEGSDEVGVYVLTQ